MTLEEAMAEIERQKTTITTLEQQLASADPEKEKARADALSKEVGSLTQKVAAKEANAKKVIAEKEAAETKAAERLTRIEELEKQIENDGGPDVAEIKKQAAEQASKDTAARIHAEYKPKMDELERVTGENKALITTTQVANKKAYFVNAMKELGVDPDSYDYHFSKCDSVFVFEDGKYVAKDASGMIMTGRSGLLTAKEHLEEIVKPKFYLKPVGGGAGGGATPPPKGGSTKKLEPGTPAHKAFMKMRDPQGFQKLYGPGGQYS